jgi:hypothetical protein
LPSGPMARATVSSMHPQALLWTAKTTSLLLIGATLVFKFSTPRGRSYHLWTRWRVHFTDHKDFRSPQMDTLLWPIVEIIVTKFTNIYNNPANTFAENDQKYCSEDTRIMQKLWDIVNYFPCFLKFDQYSCKCIFLKN